MKYSIYFSLLCCSIFIVENLYARNYYPPKDVQLLIEQAEKLNDKCRGGSGDNPTTFKACDKRDVLISKLEKKGWCFGSYNKNTAYAEYRWLPCKDNRVHN